MADTYITSKVLLLAQDDLVSIKLAFKLPSQLLHTLLIRYASRKQLENLLFGNSRRNRIKIRVLDACRLLEFGACLGLSRDQLRPRAKGREVATDSARLEQIESVILLYSTERYIKKETMRMREHRIRYGRGK